MLEGDIALNHKEKIHFIGVGGVGMSGIAKMYLEQGRAISGSDMNASLYTEMLQRQGAEIFIGHDPAHLDDTITRVVVSTAIGKDNSERMEAEKRGIPIYHRGACLADLMDEKKGIAVAGAHGKTTTSAMLATILYQELGDVSYLVGAYVEGLGTNAKWGKNPYMVAEADESDGSFLLLNPWLTLVTNIEDDHLDYYGSREKIEAAFLHFIEKTAKDGAAIVCLDDPVLARLKDSFTAPRIFTYGTQEGAWLQARHIRYQGGKMEADLYCENQPRGVLVLSVPGEHNLRNALGAIVAAMNCGVSLENAARALTSFTGAKRRFEWVGEAGNVQIFDDYAHHPTELKATLKAAALMKPKRLIALFQPHRYSRTRLLSEQFGTAFEEADLICLLPIYSAGEAPLEGVDTELIAQSIRNRTGQRPIVFEDAQQALDFLQKELSAGDLILTLGAGNVGKMGNELLKGLKAREGKDGSVSRKQEESSGLAEAGPADYGKAMGKSGS